MQPEEIILLPATHEAVACFHVKEGTSEERLQKVLDDFLKRGQSLRQ
jgi:hypothetical protein